MRTRTYVLAFDIEKSGATDQYPIIGIGASVVDENFRELDRLFLPGYFPGKTPFEPRCWDEFWNKDSNKQQLADLEYKGPKSPEERQVDMIKVFQVFRRRWEEQCDKAGIKLELVSDNNVFDGGFINNMIYRHLPKTLPIPYSAATKQEGTQTYSSFWETFSQQRGILMVVDPEFALTKEWGYSNRIKELYDGIPELKINHDHNPANDAYTIACDQQILFGIAQGRFKLKPKTDPLPVNPVHTKFSLDQFMG